MLIHMDGRPFAAISLLDLAQARGVVFWLMGAPGVKLKYQSQLEACRDQPCPCPKRFQPRECVAYRFMNNPACERDFEPKVVQDGIEGDRCIEYALSFFESLESARAKYRILAERLDAASRYGTHVGEVSLVEADGCMSQPKPDGHFSFHEYAASSLVERVEQYHAA